MENSSEAHIKILFRWDEYEDGEFWTNKEILSKMGKIQVITTKRNTLKEYITNYITGFGQKEYYTNQLVQGKLYLLEHL